MSAGKGPNVRDLQGAFRRLSGDQYKNLWFDDKIVFYKRFSLYYISIPAFLQEKQIFKCSKWRRPRDVYWTQLWGVSGTK